MLHSPWPWLQEPPSSTGKSALAISLGELSLLYGTSTAQPLLKRASLISQMFFPSIYPTVEHPLALWDEKNYFLLT